MVRIAICDDEAAEARRIEGFVRAYDDFDISVYVSSKELARDIDGGALFDLYLLDVVMPKPDGIELARLIRETDETAAIIYLTSHDERALDAYRVRASQYLVKPVDRDTLFREMDAALAAAKLRGSRTFLLKTKEGTQVIPLHRIVCCELFERTVCCLTADGQTHRGVTLRTSFDEATAKLLADHRFLRPHTSYVVNMDYVKSMQGDSLTMRLGADIPIARRAAGEIKAKYLQYFFGSDKDCT